MEKMKCELKFESEGDTMQRKRGRGKKALPKKKRTFAKARKNKRQ